MFQLISENPLSLETQHCLCTIAFDGCFFYGSDCCGCKIYRLDSCFREVACIQTIRPYACLCYDPDNCCFWASCNQCGPKLFKLNSELMEIDFINIRSLDFCRDCGIITGLSYDYCCRRLILSSSTKLISLDVHCMKETVLFSPKCCKWITGVVSIYPYYVCMCLSEEKNSLCVYSPEGALVHRLPLPCSRVVKDAVVTCCCDPCGQLRLYVLECKHHCYPYISQYSVNSHELCCCPCDYPCPPPCMPPCTHQQACNDILQSIALMEASLSHILNAEGEKLQKIVAISENPDTILEVNRSVNRTLINATNLEQVLFHKLEELNDICNLCAQGDTCKCCTPAEDGC